MTAGRLRPSQEGVALPDLLHLLVVDVAAGVMQPPREQERPPPEGRPALRGARDRRKAVDAEIRRLLAYGRDSDAVDESGLASA
jgi:hypothetical protein